MARIDRREFLKLGLAATGGAAVSQLISFGHDGTPQAAPPDSTGKGVSSTDTRSSAKKNTATSAPATASAPRIAAPVNERVLIVVELAGGNDGLNTLVPMREGRYRDLRKKVAVPEETLLPFGDGFALHPSLQRLHDRGLAVVTGVGVANPDGSHFEMMRRWWTADIDGRSAPSTGFLGRMADTVGAKDSAAVALGLGSGSSMALLSQWAPTVSLSGLNAAHVFRPNREDRMLTAFQDGFRQLATAPADGAASKQIVSVGMQRALGTARLLDGKFEEADSAALPSSDIGRRFADTLPIIRESSIGVRIVHITHDGFDTHTSSLDQHAYLLKEFSEAVDAFLAVLDSEQLGHKVLVATTSEFGRRVKDNESSGLDHGAASVALLAGTVNPGVYGEYPSLSNLDDDDNLKATMSLGTYYATLAQWLGVDPSEVLGTNATGLEGVIRV